MASLYLFLFIPVVMAKINIEIIGTFHKIEPNFNIYVIGGATSAISEEELKTFNLTEHNLKLGIKEYFGEEPNDVFVKSPTPWGDLYQSLKWQPVTRILTPKCGKILKTTVKNATILQQTFENHAKKPITYNVGVTKTAENAVKTVWQNGGRLTVIDDISYNIEVDSAGKRTEFGYTTKWGHDSEQAQFLTIGTPKIEITLMPYQTITSKLQATKIDMIFEIEYTSFLSGYLAANYPGGYKGYRFWGLAIGAVMANAGLTNDLKSKEEVEFTFYVDPRIIVHDNDTGVKLMEVAC